HQLDQHAFSADGEGVVAFRVHEGDVEAGRTASDSPRGEAHAVRTEPVHRLGQVVHPQADVIERRRVYRRLLLRIQWLHQIHFDLEWPAADRADVLVDVLALGNEVAGDFQP